MVKLHLFAATLLFAFVRSQQPSDANSLQPKTVCLKISHAISLASEVYFPGQARYEIGISHFAASSSQNATCVVEPGTVVDVGIILEILGSTRTPFAVKGGGHILNPGFSSTTGVHVSMNRFSDVTYSPGSQTAVIGAGLIWDDVYAALAPYNVNVVGGRVTGIGVAGFTLGGGYSWLTNQHGLSSDTVVAYELVLPSGKVTTVTEKTEPDLFFGLKGGFNNFGIVTRFTFKTFPQAEVWGGSLVIAEPFIDAAAAATVDFSTRVKDPKAQIISTFAFASGQPFVSVLLFYNGPTAPPGIFDAFLAIPVDQSEVRTRSFLSLVQSSPANTIFGFRGVFNAVNTLQYTPTIVDVIRNETVFWGNRLSTKSGFLAAYALEPFLPSIFSHASSATAYPPVRSLALLPTNANFVWTSAEFDDDFRNAARKSAAHVHAAEVAEGQLALIGSPVYPNYAISGTPLKDIYGENVHYLHKLQRAVDPNNVMGLAGGWKL